MPSIRAGSTLGGYNIIKDFVLAGQCRWTFAERDGKEYFIKQFLQPKMPNPNTSTEKTFTDRVDRCKIFETRHISLFRKLGSAFGFDGNVVVPIDFFRHGATYYHVSPKINIYSQSIGQISNLPFSDRLWLTRLLVHALARLHDVKIVHGDLKPANILIQKTAAGIFVPRIIDFDGSYFAHDPPAPDEMSGDQNYMAPEVISYNRHSGSGGVVKKELYQAADVFSLGIILYEYWTGKRPSLPESSQSKYIGEAAAAGLIIDFQFGDMPPTLSALLPKMLAAAPRERPTCAAIDRALGALMAADLEPAAGIGPRIRLSKSTLITWVWGGPLKSLEINGPGDTTQAEQRQPSIRLSRNLRNKSE